jgi:hypothetical protein
VSHRHFLLIAGGDCVLFGRFLASFFGLGTATCSLKYTCDGCLRYLTPIFADLKSILTWKRHFSFWRFQIHIRLHWDRLCSRKGHFQALSDDRRKLLRCPFGFVTNLVSSGPFVVQMPTTNQFSCSSQLLLKKHPFFSQFDHHHQFPLSFKGSFFSQIFFVC